MEAPALRPDDFFTISPQNILGNGGVPIVFLDSAGEAFLGWSFPNGSNRRVIAINLSADKKTATLEKKTTVAGDYVARLHYPGFKNRITSGFDSAWTKLGKNVDMPLNPDTAKDDILTAKAALLDARLKALQIAEISNMLVSLSFADIDHVKRETEKLYFRIAPADGTPAPVVAPIRARPAVDKEKRAPGRLELEAEEQ